MIENYKITKNWETFEKYRKDSTKGLKTGFKEIDRALRCLPGFVTVMGEPKCCKSTFVMSIALSQAQQGTPVLYFESENGIQRTRLRMLCNIANITDGTIKGKASKGEEFLYNNAVQQLETLPIYYINHIESSESLEEMIKELGQKYKRPILFIVDSIQNLINDFKDRRASVDFWVFFFNELKNKYTNYLTILCVSEKNRQFYGIGSKAGAKESGGIEYKSELTLDLWPNKEDNSINVECVFYRDGDTGIISRLIKPSPYCYKLEEQEYIPE